MFVFARRPVYRAPILLALVGVGVLARYGVTHGMWIQTPLTFVDNFACGMLAAIVVVRAWRTRAALLVAALAFAAALVVGATGGQVAGLAVAGALFAVALALVATSQIVPPRALVWVGTVSYGVYLWHWPVLEVTTNHGLYRLPDSVEIAVVAGTAVLLGWLSWRIVELPALRQRGAMVALLPRQVRDRGRALVDMEHEGEQRPGRDKRRHAQPEPAARPGVVDPVARDQVGGTRGRSRSSTWCGRRPGLGWRRCKRAACCKGLQAFALPPDVLLQRRRPSAGTTGAPDSGAASMVPLRACGYLRSARSRSSSAASSVTDSSAACAVASCFSPAWPPILRASSRCFSKIAVT